MGTEDNPTGLWVILLYPPVAVAASLLGIPWLKGLLLPLIVIVIAWHSLVRGDNVAWGILGALCLAAIAGMVWPVVSALLPACAILALASWFWWSLHPRSTPLIRRFARCVHESQGQAMPENSDGWLRGWTVIWAATLTTVGVIIAVLAANGQELYWLVWVFGVLPVALVLLLGIEYLLRLRRFPDYPHLSWTGFLRTLGGIRWQHIAS